MKPSRVRWVCYSPNYIPGVGKCKVVRTKKLMKATLQKFGANAEAHKEYLIHRRNGTISYWNINPQEPLWVYTG